MAYFICVIDATVDGEKAEKMLFLDFFMGKEVPKNSICNINWRCGQGEIRFNGGGAKKK